jgi:hypothetical protein
MGALTMASTMTRSACSDAPDDRVTAAFIERIRAQFPRRELCEVCERGTRHVRLVPTPDGTMLLTASVECDGACPDGGCR